MTEGARAQLDPDLLHALDAMCDDLGLERFPDDLDTYIEPAHSGDSHHGERGA